MIIKKKEAHVLVGAMMASVIPYTSGLPGHSKEIPSEYEKAIISLFLKLCKKAKYVPKNDWEHNIIADCYAILRNN